MKHLTQVHLGELRGQLLAREQQLAAEIGETLADRQAHEDEGREVDPGVDDLETALGFADALRDQVELDAVRAALGRLDRGTYGRCLDCGVSIPLERLRVQAEASLCQVCQTRAEGHLSHGPFAP